MHHRIHHNQRLSARSSAFPQAGHVDQASLPANSGRREIALVLGEKCPFVICDLSSAICHLTFPVRHGFGRCIGASSFVQAGFVDGMGIGFDRRFFAYISGKFFRRLIRGRRQVEGRMAESAR